MTTLLLSLRYSSDSISSYSTFDRPSTMTIPPEASPAPNARGIPQRPPAACLPHHSRASLNASRALASLPGTARVQLTTRAASLAMASSLSATRVRVVGLVRVVVVGLPSVPSLHLPPRPSEEHEVGAGASHAFVIAIHQLPPQPRDLWPLRPGP